MGRIIGIDLGTTYSAVAIPEERSGDGFLVIPECPGYSVILDALGRPITPSVVAEDENGEIVVGYAAKARAGLSPEPIMFAKRWMGEDKSFQLAKQGTLLPVDVSAHILRYLKKMAEERLGESVDEAVITVPAYFSLKARQLTEKAGEMAGLRVAQIAQEPVAAALMYCVGDSRDPLRIMTYDLGGGTFDIAILEKRDGAISTNSIRAFDGDRFLGGFNFDQSLALWIMDQLNLKGYDLYLNLEKPADKVIFAKLMVYAERAKIALSKDDSCEIQEPETGISDHANKPVALYLGLSRAMFEAMIGEQIEYTVQLCNRARSEKADPPIPKNKFDEIIMVGGSSRIPLVARRLEAEFGKTPKLIKPDLCVALGAAVIAGTKPLPFDYLRLDPIPAEIDLPTLTVTGRVVPGENLKAVQGCSVNLRASDGSFGSSRKVATNGSFVFDGVGLTPGEVTDFTLSVASPSGAVIASHIFSVKQTDAPTIGPVEPVTNVLSKPICVQTVEGIRVIAPERTPLPFEKTVLAKSMDTSGEIRVPILEENNPLGEIVMKEIPTTLPVGSTVEVILTIQENYQIHGRAFVKALAREAAVIIDLPVRVQKGVDELRRECETLTAQAEDALASAPKGKLFGDAKATRLKQRIQNCQSMLQSRVPDPAAVQDCLDEIESLVRDVGTGWRPDPPRDKFDEKINEAQDFLAAAIKKKPKVASDGYDRQLEAIQTEAIKAYSAQNGAVWKESYEKLQEICDRLEAVAKPDDVTPPTSPGVLLLSLARELATLESWAKEGSRYPEFAGAFNDLAVSLKRIDPKGADALTQMRDWYFTKFSDLRQRLEAPKVTGLIGL